MKQKVIIPALLIIIVLGILYIYIQISLLGLDPIAEIIRSMQRDPEGEYTGPETNPNNPSERPQQTIGGTNPEGNGDSSSSNSENPGTTCRIQPLPYALRKPKTEENCNSFNGETCIDKTVICNVEAHNLEFTNPGNFEIRTTIVNENYEEIYLTTESKNIEPRGFETFTSQTSFQDQNANQKLTCLFNTVSVPTGEVCS